MKQCVLDILLEWSPFVSLEVLSIRGEKVFEYILELLYIHLFNY